MSITPQKPNPPRIVTVALDNHVVYALLVLVRSLFVSRSQDFHLIIGYFPGQLRKSNIRVLADFLTALGQSWEIRELVPHPLFTERRHLTMTTFSKFVLSDEIPEAHLWLDIDTVARPGWDDVFPKLFAVNDKVKLLVADKLESAHTRFSGFNAGVLGWTRSPREAWLNELENLPEKRFSSEQHLFNILYGNQTNTMDVSFNFLSSWHDSTFLEEARIIHYSGPVKPWHLARRHKMAWRNINASWNYWFTAEQEMLTWLSGQELSRPVQEHKRRALLSGRLHTGKGSLAAWVLRALVILGPLGDPLVKVLTRR